MLYFGKLRTKGREMAKTEPSVDQWLREAKADPAAAQCGMFLTHNGVVRITPKAQVREGVEGLGEVVAVEFSYDAEGLAAAERYSPNLIITDVRMPTWPERGAPVRRAIRPQMRLLARYPPNRD